MKKSKPKDIFPELRAKNLDIDVEGCESLLAPTVLKCLNAYGAQATKRALEWMITCVNEKHEDEDE